MSPDLMEALIVVATQICLGTYVMLLVEFRQPERSWRLRWIAAVTLVVAANIVLILSVGYWGVYTRLGAATGTLPYVLITLWCSSCRGMRVVFNIATALFIGCIGVVNAELARALAPSVSWLPLLVRVGSFLLLFLLLRQFRRMYQQMLRLLDRGWGLLCLVPLVTTLLVLVISNSFFLAFPLPTVLFLYGLLVICAATYGLMFLFFRTIWEESQTRSERALLAVQVTALRGRLETMREAEEAIRLERHDRRHYLQAIAALARRGDTQAILDLIGSTCQQAEERAPLRWCRPPILDAVFSFYFSQAAQSGVQIQAEIHLPSRLPADECELAIVFANALENALHAVQALPVEKRRLSCKVIGRPTLMIEIANPTAGPVPFDDQGLPVAAEAGHGLGIRSITAFCQKYAFLCHFEVKDGWFYLRVIQ